MMRIFGTLLVLLSTLISLSAQQTVGLLEYKQSQTYQGYTLIYPHNQPNVYLIDNCGEVVHSWTDDEDFRPGNTAYLLEDGRLVKTKRPSSVANDAIWAGGGGAIIEIRTWENELLWSYELNNEDARLHHDIAITPDETILAIAWENKTMEEAIAAGRNPELLSQGNLWPDYVFEIDPATDEIVWEWYSWDHLVQDFDETKPNFGNVASEFRKIDLNWDTNDGKSDWHHMNSIAYNPELRQIMLSVPQYNEIWVIDHSTTTEQAATGNGGISNHGGDIIYRVGNQQAYSRGDSTDQWLYYQHDAHWIIDVPSSHPDFGKVAVFNNRIGDDFSTAEIFTTSWEMYISDYETFDGTFPPYADNDDRKTISHPDPQRMYSTGLSSIQPLPNGNYLLCSGRQGYIYELTPDNEIVWEYITPLRAGAAVEQGTELELNNNLTFRAYKYSLDYPAFDGKDLEPKGYIELSPNEEYCNELILSTEVTDEWTAVIPNPAVDMVKISWATGMMVNIHVYDFSGRIIKSETANGGNHYLDISDLHSGLYLVRVNNGSAIKLIKR